MTQALERGSHVYSTFAQVVCCVLVFVYFWFLTLSTSFLVCIHVGPHLVAARSTRRRTNRLRLFGLDDDHYHGRSPLSAATVLYWKS